MHGSGVKQDLDKAEKYFHTAHTLSNTEVINCLVDLNILKEDFDRALMWHERALANKSINAINRDEELRIDIAARRHSLKQLKSEIGDKAAEEVKNIAKNIHKLNMRDVTTPDQHFIDPKVLLEYGQKGSVTATEMLKSQICMIQAQKMLESASFPNIDAEEFIKVGILLPANKLKMRI